MPDDLPDDAPAPPRPSDTSVHLALHALIDGMTPDLRWLVLQMLDGHSSTNLRKWYS